jgi:hypothetical protein
MKEIKIRIETLNGQSLINDNLVNVITSGIFTASRIDLTGEQRLSVRDMGSDVMELTVKIDAVNLQKVIDCANSQ